MNHVGGSSWCGPGRLVLPAGPHRTRHAQAAHRSRCRSHRSAARVATTGRPVPGVLAGVGVTVTWIGSIHFDYQERTSNQMSLSLPPSATRSISYSRGGVDGAHWMIVGIVMTEAAMLLCLRATRPGARRIARRRCTGSTPLGRDTPGPRRLRTRSSTASVRAAERTLFDERSCVRRLRRVRSGGHAAPADDVAAFGEMEKRHGVAGRDRVSGRSGRVRTTVADGWFCPTAAATRRRARRLLDRGWSSPSTSAARCCSSSTAVAPV